MDCATPLLGRSPCVGRVGIAALLTGVVACGGSSSRSSFDPQSSTSGTSGGSENGGSLGNVTGDGGSTSTSVSQTGCSEAAKLVYVLSQERDLYSFRPDTLTFTKVGTLNCPSSTTPNSMAIDRSGTAWVNYSDGSLFKVSTQDASCQATSFRAGQSGFGKFGMAFATNAANSTDETLFVSGIADDGTGQGLAKIDLSSLRLEAIGNYSGLMLSFAGAELTGTGDGRLYGFFTTIPNATLAQIDPGSAATSHTKSLKGVQTGEAWAFSFWGGDFWFYTSDGEHASQVTRLRASGDGSIAVVKNDVGGFRIVGAGVSTCAPTTPVN